MPQTLPGNNLSSRPAALPPLGAHNSYLIEPRAHAGAIILSRPWRSLRGHATQRLVPALTWFNSQCPLS
jgi:hypothetical protein